jgi:Tat protein translocase TatC
MSALKPTETFMLSMKLSFFGGIVLSFPLLLFYILQFVLPGLHANEKRVLWPAMSVGFGLFLCGALFAYFVVLPRALEFFYGWSDGLGVSNDWRIGEYISFATQFTLLFGLSFELPVVVMVLVKLGLLTYETMSSTRMYAVLAIFVIAALITPTPDAFTLLLMALPMIGLYELCIWLAWFDRRRLRIEEEKEALEAEERRLLVPTGIMAADAADNDAGDMHADDWAVLPPVEMPPAEPIMEAPPTEDRHAVDANSASPKDDVPKDDAIPYFSQQEFHYESSPDTDLPHDRGPDESRSHDDR